MDVIKAVILGIVEGLTEFLPVSSTGHMILAMPLLGIDEQTSPWNVFEFFIQTGAIIAVIIYFWRHLREALLHRNWQDWRQHLATKLLVGFVPAGIVGLLLDKWMTKHMHTPRAIAVALILGALVMEWIDQRYRAGPTQ